MLCVERVTLRPIAEIGDQWFVERLPGIAEAFGDERLPMLRFDRPDRVVHRRTIERSRLVEEHGLQQVFAIA